jgi:uncharacterized repeat protein (TIGR01451 family)
MSVIAIPDRIRRSFRAGSASRVTATWVGLTALALLFACTTPVLAAPVLDGNITDVISQANTYIQNGTGCGIVINDPAGDVCLSDPLIVPCTANITTCATNGQYYVNGFDQTTAAVAVQGTDAWWGIRVVGQIGDSDGDGTDSKGGACPPPGLGQNPEDGPGIADGERYRFRIDTNCDGVIDIIITVNGGAGTKTPNVIITDGGGSTLIPGASGTAQYGTTDLEIHTTGLNLPAVFSVNTFVGSDFDGLSEDAAGPAKCNAPVVSLTILKTASKPNICAGDSDRFTVTVTNTSLVDVATNLRDVLPIGWTYSNNVSGDFTFASQSGQVVSFNQITIPAGQSRSVQFDATSPTDCLGPYENKAVADAAFSSPCLAEPATALSDTARATVTCDSKPCVSNVHCTAPEAACNGDQITVKGFATNCGDRAADVTISINGHPHTVGNVGAGQEAEFDTTFAFDCTNNQFTVSATASNSCGTSAPGNSTCSTACGALPCVSIVCAPADTTVQIGDSYFVRATVTNCSSGSEDINVTLNGQQFTFTGVASNATATAIVGPFSCETAGTSTYEASATATNNCGTTNPAVTCQAKVTCQGGLCCWLTMGGFLNANMRSGNKDNTFGGNVGPPPSGSWEHIQRNGKDEVFNFHSHDAHVIACSNDGTAGPCHPDGDANVIEFGGTGSYSLDGGKREFAATFTARAEDHGEPGRQGTQTGGCGTPDYYTITVKDAETGQVVFTAAGYLDGGNIQIHDCKHATKTSAPKRAGGSTLGAGSLSADGSSLGVDASGISVLELYRPTPNPFSNTTSFAYQVSGSTAQRVQIGIYNVAGRQIRSLVDETRAPGRYETVWNGQDMGGAQVTHGVYFIRAYIGGVRVDAASRILYLR